jgi:hypothetical protein
MPRQSGNASCQFQQPLLISRLRVSEQEALRLLPPFDRALDTALTFASVSFMMKRIQGECQHCGGSLEFPAESIGLMAQCPRCGKQTELMLATPPQEPTIPRRVIVWTAITIALLIGGFVYLLMELKHYEKRAAERRQKSLSAAHAETNNPGTVTTNLESR